MIDAGKRTRKLKTKAISQDLVTESVHDHYEKAIQQKSKVINEWEQEVMQ